MASPSKKRKRLDSQGSLADTSDVGSGDGGYTRDSHDIVVNKSRVYKKKQMKNLQMKLSAETSDKAGEGKTREKKNKDAPPTLSGQSKDVNGGTSNNSAAADGLPMSPSKGSSGTLLRRKYRRERTSSQSSTGTDHGITSLSQMEYFPLSGQEKKHSSTCTATEEEDKSIAPRNSLQTNSENRSVSEIFPWIPKSQSSQESQPPIHLDADGLLVQEDTFKKPLDPVKSSPSKYSSGLVGKSGKKKKKKKHGEKDGTSDETSGVDTDTGASVSTVQSGQEGSDNEKRHKKKKKKKREKDKDVESSAAEEQATNVPTVQSGDDNVEGDDEKRHKKKKKKKKEKDKDVESSAAEEQATNVPTVQSGDDNVEGEDKKRHKKKKEKEKVETSDSVSTRQADHDNVEEYEGKRHHKKKKKKKDKDAESNTLEGQVSAAEDSDIIPPTPDSSKPDKSKKKKKKNEESGLGSEGSVEDVLPHSQGMTLNGDLSSENQNGPNTDTTGKKKKKKSKDKRTESAYTSQSESEVPESDVGSPVKSPLAVPRRHAIENNKANTTGNASKDKPKSSASKLPVWCIEDAGQESQAVSEVFDMFGWGQNKSSSLGSKHSSQGMIRTTSTQPNFDTVVGKGRGTSAERKEKDQSHDDSTVAITPQKKSRLSRKGKQKSREQQNSVDDSVMNNTGTHDDQPLPSENTGDTAKENTLQESVDEVPMTSKLPSESAGKNVTDRRKRTKKDVLEEAESSVDKEHAEKRRKMESKKKQRNSTEKQTPVEEENVEENPEEAQDQVVTDNKDEDEDSDSSGEDFEDAVPSSSTTRSSPRIRAIRESRKRGAGTSSTGDAEDMWLKGVQALSAEDVQELKEKGVTVRFGHFSRREKAILKKNMESFCEMHGVEDNRTLLFPHQYPEKKNLKKLIHESGMFRHLAQGLNRPLWNVYTKARYMFSNPEKSGKFSPEDDKLLLRLYKQHGPRWARISRSMGRFEDHIKQRFRNMKGKGKNRGAWSAKENKMLIRAVQAVTGQEDISNVTQNINWQACSDMMNTVRGAKQCYEHWLVLLNWLSFQQGSPIWNPERDAQLIDEIYKSEAEFDYDIDWQDIAKNMDWLKHHMQARRRFRRLKLRVPDCDRQDMDGILDYLKEDLKKKVQEWMKTKEKRASLPRPAKSGPFIFTDDEDDDDDDSDDDTLDADGNTAENHQDNDKSDDDGNDDDDEEDADDNTNNHQDNDDNDDDTDANHQGSDNPAPISDKESAKVDNTGSTSKAGHDNKSDVESSDDSDDDSKTEVDTSDEE
ncbi:uncharacterized protein LOC144918586 [Branchiostoma floridae x Branchiostoma belcheri]